MKDPGLVNLAQIMVRYSTEVKKGDRVIIRGFPLEANATPLIQEIVREVLHAGGYPHIIIDAPGVTEILLNEASDDQLQYVDPFHKMMIETFDVDIRLSSATNTKGMMNVNLESLGKRQKAYAELSDIWMKRSASDELRWVVARYPTNAYAQDADMSLAEYEKFLFSTTYADRDDPIAAYEAIRDAQEKLVKWLEGKDRVQLKGPNVDLELSVKGRKFINCCGHRNIPDGEIFTGPVENSLNGWVRFSYPTAHRGIEVAGVEFHFKDGEITKFQASKGEEVLAAMFKGDPATKYVGELGIGTNREITQLTKDMLFDEKTWGTIHLAIGAGYPETGSKNKSPIHWDMLCDMRDGGQIIVDGELFYEGGEFRI